MSGGAWGDLGPRLASAAIMAVVGIGAVWAGGVVFLALVAGVCGLMVWELARMLAPDRRAEPLQLAMLAAAALVLAYVLPPFYAFPLLLAPALVGVGLLRERRLVFGLGAALILLAGFGFLQLRAGQGVAALLWLVLVVIASDVAGYFAGRLLGGPKFWPRVSPKKTWSGTVAGWIGAALVGLVFWRYAGGAAALIWLSVLAAFAAQMGDIGESAIKRHVGVKDSSALIPGHGGVLDRFDAMLGASLFVLLAGLIAGLPRIGA